MSEGGGLLGDYYTPHYEAPFGNRMARPASREGERDGVACCVLSSLVDAKSERDELIKNHGCVGTKICGA